MATETNEMSLKLLVDGKAKKVLYAEAKKDFIDFLFGILQLPIGSIMTLLVDNELQLEVADSLGRVLQSVSDMGTSHFHSSLLKDTLVKPKVFSEQPQKLYNPPLLLQKLAPWDSIGTTPTPTQTPCCSVSGRRTTKCYQCGHLCVTAPPEPTKVEGYLKVDNCAYMVMDDLVVCPLSTASVFSLLQNFKIKDLCVLTVKVDLKKGVELVKASMELDTVLSDVFTR